MQYSAYLHVVCYEYKNTELLLLSGITEQTFHLLKARRSLKTDEICTGESGTNVNMIIWNKMIQIIITIYLLSLCLARAS
jgi:hypothetical protein